jgi:hypothetical protein
MNSQQRLKTRLLMIVGGTTLGLVAACGGSTSDDSPGQVQNTGGSSQQSGSGGTSTAGTAGTSSTSGQAGMSGTAGTAGGISGEGGTAGTAGTAGVAGGTSGEGGTGQSGTSGTAGSGGAAGTAGAGGTGMAGEGGTGGTGQSGTGGTAGAAGGTAGQGGTAGTAGAAGGTAGAGGSATLTCSKDVPANFEFYYGCYTAGVNDKTCMDWEDPKLLDMLPEECGVKLVPLSGPYCGPLAGKGQCCYEAQPPPCVGRPLLVETQIRIANGMQRLDWIL